MPIRKSHALAFGACAGVAAAAAVLGLALIGLALGITLVGDSGTPWHEHPLFAPGLSLIGSSAVASVPLLVLWRMGRA